MKKAVLAAALLSAAGVAFGPQADTGCIIARTQQGSDVVATGSASIDVTDLSFFFASAGASGVHSPVGTVVFGPVSGTPDDAYTGFTGPTSFGGRSAAGASSGSGDFVSIGDDLARLGVPKGHVPGAALSSNATRGNATFASLGMTQGSYV